MVPYGRNKEKKKKEQYTTFLSELLITLEIIFLEIIKVSHMYIVKYVLVNRLFKNVYCGHLSGKVVLGKPEDLTWIPEVHVGWKETPTT